MAMVIIGLVLAFGLIAAPLLVAGFAWDDFRGGSR